VGLFAGSCSGPVGPGTGSEVIALCGTLHYEDGKPASKIPVALRSFSDVDSLADSRQTVVSATQTGTDGQFSFSVSDTLRDIVIESVNLNGFTTLTRMSLDPAAGKDTLYSYLQ